MRILHTSDWHLGKIIHEHSLVEDQAYALQQLVALQKNDPHDAIIVAGDVYDRSLPSAEAVSLLSKFLSDMRSVSPVPIIIIPGNHDSSTRLSYCADIISVSNIYIKTDPFAVEKPVVIRTNDETLHVYAVPYLEPWVYNYHNLDEEQTRPTHESVIQEALTRIHQQKDNSAINILVSHLYASGGTVSDSERKFIGTSGEVSAALLNCFDYIALGHLHKPQQVNNITYYSGSLLQYSFSEHDQQKQALSVAVDKNSLLVNPRCIAPLRKMVKVKGRFNELLSDNKLSDMEQYYIEAELTDELLVVNPLSQLKKRFPNILSVRQEPKNTLAVNQLLQKERIVEGSTITDDFISFYEYLYAELPQQDVVKLFNTLWDAGLGR